jgi:hypothetical protein
MNTAMAEDNTMLKIFSINIADGKTSKSQIPNHKFQINPK